MHKRVPTHVLATAALTVAAVGALGAGAASAHESDSRSEGGHHRAVTLKAELHELNDSGASGRATVVIKDGEIAKVRVRARGLTPNMPHAQHIHYGEQAANECPGIDLDVDPKDGRINTVEGIPAYGPVVVSLNTTGDTTPASFLDVSRFPTASDEGRIKYRRSHVAFTDVAGTGYAGGGTAAEIRASILEGEGVVVIHGLDYNGNDVYDFEGAGVSELTPGKPGAPGVLPAEGTDPAVCGVLK